MVKRQPQEGSILITVLVALAIIAAVSHMLNLQQSTQVRLNQPSSESYSAQYLAESGLRHALWRVRTTTSGNYPGNIGSSLPGQGEYSAKITPNTGSPVTIHSTGIAANGSTYQVSRTYTLGGCFGKTVSSATLTAYENKGVGMTITEGSANNAQNGFYNPKFTANSQVRAIMRFDLSNLPKGIPFQSAELFMDVLNHDPALEGDTLIVNRLTKLFDSQWANWVNYAKSSSWEFSGGDFSFGDEASEASTTIAAGVTSYKWSITPMVHGWVNGAFTHNGLIVRVFRDPALMNVKPPPGTGQSEFRLRKKDQAGTTLDQAPRLHVTWCI